jgi:hypothetical protein
MKPKSLVPSEEIIGPLEDIWEEYMQDSADQNNGA